MRQPGKRPRGVPAEATFHEEWGEWIAGKKVGGKCVGEWRQWHATRGHLTCIDVYDRRGRLQRFTRFHPDGTFSQKVSHKDGKPHGVALYQGSKRATTERVLEHVPSRKIFSFQLFWERGEQTYPARFFDRAGREVSARGVPRPAGLPEGVRSTPDGGWILGEEELQRRYRGLSRWWRATGELHSEEVRGRTGRLEQRREYHPDGSLAKELDYRAKRGRLVRAAGKTDLAFDELVGAIHEVRFDLQVLDPKSGLYDMKQPQYLGADGAPLTAKGRPIARPPDGAIEVTDGSWMNPQRYWLCEVLDARGRKHGTARYFREDGTKYLELDHDRGRLVGLRQFDGRGQWLLEERFHPGRLDKQKRPVVASISVQVGKERHDVTCDDQGRGVAFAVVRGGKRSSRLDNKKLGKLTPERFAKEVARRYAKLMRHAALCLSSGFCEVMEVAVAHFADHLRVASLTRDTGGNAAVLVEEGKHRGRVYFLDHEEGLFGLDCIDEFLEEEGIEADALSRDELVEAMPFFSNPLADSLDAFFRGLSLRSHLTHYRGLEKLAPPAPKRRGRGAARARRRRSPAKA